MRCVVPGVSLRWEGVAAVCAVGCAGTCECVDGVRLALLSVKSSAAFDLEAFGHPDGRIYHRGGLSPAVETGPRATVKKRV